jgi:hypothetical protein
VPELPGRDVAFVALALLRRGEHVGQLLETLPEPRRKDLSRIATEFEAFADARLKQLLAEAVRRDDAALAAQAEQALAGAGAQVSRAIRKLAARCQWP